MLYARHKAALLPLHRLTIMTFSPLALDLLLLLRFLTMANPSPALCLLSSIIMPFYDAVELCLWTGEGEL